MRDGTETRKKLERAALTFFVQKGVNATTIKDIAKASHIAEGTLYRHYVSKEALAEALFIRGYEMVLGNLQQLIGNAKGLDDIITKMVHYFCEKYDEDPILFNYLLLVQHNLRSAINNEMNAHRFFVQLFKQAIADKTLPTQDADFCALVLTGIVLQAAVSRVYGRIQRSMVADQDQLVCAVLGALRALK